MQRLCACPDTKCGLLKIGGACGALLVVDAAIWRADFEDPDLTAIAPNPSLDRSKQGACFV